MANGARASKGFSMGNPHVAMLPEPDRKRQNERLRQAKPDSPEANPARRTRCQRIRFRFVLLLIIMTREELWTSRALLVDGLRVRLRRFRKSHHLIPAGPGATQRECSRQRRVGQARIALRRAYHRIWIWKGKVETACPSSKASSIPGTIRSQWSRTSPPITTGRSNAPAKTR